jgi:pimeloyl-ACP methyl ester carboxylesterase
LEHLDVEALRALADLFRGPFLEGLELPNQPAFTTWRLGQREQARRLHACVLDALAEKLDAWTERADVLRKRVDLDPGDVEAHVGLIGALACAGAKAEAEAQREASARMLSAIGPFDKSVLDEAASRTRASSRAPQRAAAAEDEPQLRQEVRFCTARDGVRIAYATVGEGPPLVKTANWLNHLEFDWESPIKRHFFRAFAKNHTFIRYDSRGNGLSDWDAPDLSLNAFVTDLKAVADAAGLERFPLLAMSQGVPVAIEFAVRHPERVSKLVLLGGYARGWRKRGEGDTYVAQQEAMITLTRTGWGRDNPAFRQLFTSYFIPDATPEQMDAFDRLQRTSTSPENAARLLEAFGDIDVRDKLRLVQAATLVLHVRNDARIGYANGKEVAAGIPGARFVTLEGRNHLILEAEPAWPHFLAEAQAFLAE